ncbi:PTS sugar transporter subunit IIA [Aliikangiella maris]|uniref:PTS sugar transporter subunit IIA n=2 Tax=Aliikangiella maris TaxID=3162458 RepID=A0ABV3MQP0_9GAMM
MNINQLLTPEATFCSLKLSSKKKILEKVSETLAQSIDCPVEDIFESLFTREKLGSTALGHGIAIPHGRVKACQKATAVFILLDEPVDYDAPDNQPVDIIFAIMVPEQADNEQLRSLAEIAKILSDSTLVSQIRHAHCREALIEILVKASETIH